MINAIVSSPWFTHALVLFVGVVIGAALVLVLLFKNHPSHPGDAIDKHWRL